jgi:hypothetical protein
MLVEPAKNPPAPPPPPAEYEYVLPDPPAPPPPTHKYDTIKLFALPYPSENDIAPEAFANKDLSAASFIEICAVELKFISVSIWLMEIAPDEGSDMITYEKNCSRVALLLQ